MSLLELSGVDAGYGRTPVLRGINLRVNEGEVVAILGRNGVGKTTLLKTAMRITQIYRGTVTFAGRDVTRSRTHTVARAGLQFVPEDRGIFPQFTVEENLRLGALVRNGQRPEYDEVLKHFPALQGRMKQVAGSLSGGERQMLALARALITGSRMLLLDEFSEGLQPTLVQRLASVLQEIVASGVAIALVEQNVRLALELSHRTVILEKGEVVDSGPSADFGADEERLKKHLVV